MTHTWRILYSTTILAMICALCTLLTVLEGHDWVVLFVNGFVLPAFGGLVVAIWLGLGIDPLPTKETLSRTAEILEDFAEGIREGNTIVGSSPPDWNGDVVSERLYNECLALIEKLTGPGGYP